MNAYGAAARRLRGITSRWKFGSCRQQHIQHKDGRQRISDLWMPTIKARAETNEASSATSLLVDAGFIRQSYAGIYQFLPLGLRVLDKVERLIDHHMRSVGASKISLSSISSQKLWDRSGRLANGSEMFKFEDRGKSKWLLAPTHEEEITNLLTDEIFAEQHLPVRLYQIGRKYRDEQRPRGGLLRGREFIMKDLYTFDASPEAAVNTYETVREAYNSFFVALGLPYVEARADSGNMGGDLSHEFHFLHESGEDNIISCDNCGQVRNEEFVPTTARLVQDVSHLSSPKKESTSLPVDVRDFISANHDVLARVIFPTHLDNGKPFEPTDVNAYAVKEAMKDFAEVHTGIEEYQVMQMFQDHLRKGYAAQVVYLVDKRVADEQVQHRVRQDLQEFGGEKTHRFVVRSLMEDVATESQEGEKKSMGANSGPINLLKLKTGDACPQCEAGSVKVRTAIEIGHTFHLGVRYSSKLGLGLLPKTKGGERVAVEMGCHGIGVTRLIAAAAGCLSTRHELRWPAVIAPYNIIICTGSKDADVAEAANALYDELQNASAGWEIPLGQYDPPTDVVLDDRKDQNYAKKLKDAHSIGCSVIIMLGKSLKIGMAEVICPRLEYRKDVPLDEVQVLTYGMLTDLSLNPPESIGR